jgi:AraC-like DNA-binding protein
MKQALSLEVLYPGTYLAILSRLLMENGADIDSLLADYQLKRSQLLDPSFLLPVKTTTDILTQCLTLWPDPQLGFRFGQRVHLGSHGDLGIATLASETLGEAVAVYCKYSQTRIPFLRMELRVEGDNAIVSTQELLDLGALRQFNSECCMSSSFAVLHSLGLPISPAECEVRLHYEEPANVEYYQRYLPAKITFNAGHQEHVFPKHFLSYPMPMRSTTTHRLAVGRLDERTGREYQSTGDAVRSLIDEHLAKGITLAEAAEKLNCSSRTLIRKLAAEGFSFKSLLLNARRNQACYFLTQTQIPADEISSLLGYSEPANFTRAFKRWFGVTPSEYRRADAVRV